MSNAFTKQRSLGKTGALIAALIVAVWVSIDYLLPGISGLIDQNSSNNADALFDLGAGILFIAVVVPLVYVGLRKYSKRTQQEIDESAQAQ